MLVLNFYPFQSISRPFIAIKREGCVKLETLKLLMNDWIELYHKQKKHGVIELKYWC
jgi:hypothetical protein